MSKDADARRQSGISDTLCQAKHQTQNQEADPKIRAHYEKVGKIANRQGFPVAVSDFCEGKNLLEKK